MSEEASGAKGGMGTRLQLGRGTSPETYDDIAEISDLKYDGISVNVAKRTHFGSPDGFEEKIGVMADGGTVTAEMNFRPDDPRQSVLWDVISTVPQEPRNWRVWFGSNDDPIGKLIFSGVLSKLPANIPHDNVMTGSLTIEVSGKPEIE